MFILPPIFIRNKPLSYKGLSMLLLGNGLSQHMAFEKCIVCTLAYFLVACSLWHFRHSHLNPYLKTIKGNTYKKEVFERTAKHKMILIKVVLSVFNWVFVLYIYANIK